MKQNDFHVEVIKTSKIEVDNKSHRLPPHLGAYREFMVSEYFCPDEWSKDGVFIPVQEGDPLWFDFRRNSECACVAAIQRINPLTGEPANLESGLSKDPSQNYMCLPEQKWLDGYVKEGKVYQFRVTKSGVGLAVNEYVLPLHMQDSHAIGFAFFDLKNPKPKVTYTPYKTPDFYRGIEYYQHSLMPQQIGNSQFTQSKAKWIDSNTQSMHINSVMRSAGIGGAQCCNGASPAAASNDLDNNMSYNSSVLDDFADGEPIVTCCNISINDPLFIGNSADTWQNTLQIEEVDLTALEKASMGAGGRIIQDIYQDTNSVDYYKTDRSALLTIYFALPEMFKAIMDSGKRQDASRPDTYKTSGHIAGIAVPLMVD